MHFVGVAQRYDTDHNFCVLERIEYHLAIVPSTLCYPVTVTDNYTAHSPLCDKNSLGRWVYKKTQRNAQRFWLLYDESEKDSRVYSSVDL